jgi:hypothetical protein
MFQSASFSGGGTPSGWGAAGSANSCNACESTGSTAHSEVTAPRAAPGTFTISALPRTPQTPRLNTANGVSFSPSARICSANPSSNRVQTAQVASGVTSRTVRPVPPVVTIRRCTPAAQRNASSIASCSSATVRCPSTENPYSRNKSATAGPERSSRSPRAHRSLTVRTKAANGPDWLGRGTELIVRGGAWTLPAARCVFCCAQRDARLPARISRKKASLWSRLCLDSPSKE